MGGSKGNEKNDKVIEKGVEKMSNIKIKKIYFVLKEYIQECEGPF